MRVLILFFTALLALPAWAQEDAMKNLPGYVDFGQLSQLFGQPSVHIAVGPSLLSMVGALSASEDPETAALFKRLKGVRIQSFEYTGLVAGAVEHVEAVSAKLSALGWESVIEINSQKELLRIFMKTRDNVVEGMTVMTVEEGEATFINVIGSLSPAELSKVMDKFDHGMSGDTDEDASDASDATDDADDHNDEQATARKDHSAPGRSR